MVDRNFLTVMVGVQFPLGVHCLRGVMDTRFPVTEEYAGSIPVVSALFRKYGIIET